LIIGIEAIGLHFLALNRSLFSSGEYIFLMSSNDGYNIGRESADNPLSRAMNRVALERLKNEEKSNPLCGSPVQEKPYSAQRKIIPMIPSLLGVNRSSTPIQSKALRSVLYHNQQKSP